MRFSVSKRLIENAKDFLEIRHYSLVDKFLGKKGVFYGWGRKKSGQEAIKLAQKHKTSFVLLEDGFVRSIGLGSQKSPSFSIVEDNIGIYYDATKPSLLENILNGDDFDEKILNEAREAISLIIKHNISKYNHAKYIADDYFPKNGKKRVLIAAQTKNDSSLIYGLADSFSTIDMINKAYEENKDADIYLKIHPEALKGDKPSDINKDKIPNFCKLITDDVNPISLLKHIDKVYTKTSNVGFEALMLGKECVCFGMPFYGGWGISDDRVRCDRRVKQRSVEEIFAAAYILYARYYHPYDNIALTVTQTIQELARIRDNNLYKKGFFFGFSKWKHDFLKPFLEPDKLEKQIFINPIFGKNHLCEARKKGLDANSLIYIWGKKQFKDIEEFTQKNEMQIIRVEDGFIRSIELGSDLTRPYSLVFDKLGIYFDASWKSELEHILKTTIFNQKLIDQSKKTLQFLINKKISKYNVCSDEIIDVPSGKKVIFVVGQVENDASIVYGSNNMSNVKLLQIVKEQNPLSYIIYKPHPDVTAKNRLGLSDKKALLYADKIVKHASIDSVFRVCDEVHTITSLVGFEAILRGKKVVTYGMPFYAGWGLSEDTLKCERRARKLSIYELIAGVLILYPRYIHPQTYKICDIMTFLINFEQSKIQYNNDALIKKLIKFFIRKAQFLYRLLKSE